MPHRYMQVFFMMWFYQISLLTKFFILLASSVGNQAGAALGGGVAPRVDHQPGIHADVRR